MKIKTSEMTGAALDWAVAKCWYSDRRVELTRGKTGVRVLRDPTYDGSEHSHWFVFFGSNNWAQGGPIIEREGICLYFNPEDAKAFEWHAEDRSHALYLEGTTPLIAAMRCYVASKLGDEVDVPDELTGVNK